MKMKIFYISLLILFASDTFSQSEIDYQTGSGLVVEAGADICADTVIINGSFSIAGTICGSSLLQLNLIAFIEGFYNSQSNVMISDTIEVYLRSAAIPYNLVDSSISTLDSLGSGKFYFSNAVNGANYYIVLKHRNSIETWSQSGNAFAGGTLNYNFASAANKAYGNNQHQIDNTPVKYGIYSGDVNQDGIVDLDDGSLVDNDSYNFLSGYVATDVNGDNFTDISDNTITDNNSFNFVTVIKP
ncbi:MAG: hypothetical protein M3R36_10355 [Bacteroidota bacterium]|nr:hypothetical protein [Bacteroidota bacterium]